MKITIEQKDQFKTALIMRLPNLFDGAKSYLVQLYAIIHTYQNRKDYQVTQVGFNCIYSLVYKYIEVRNGTFFPSSMIPDLDYSNDNFLTDVFENLTSIQRTAIKDKDLEITRQILNCFTKIALKCTTIRYRINLENEYIHCMLAAEYVKQNIEAGLNTSLLDIGIQGSENLRDIGLALVNKNAQTNVAGILNHLFSISQYGLLIPNTSYLVSGPLKAFSVLLRAVLYSKTANSQRFLSEKILKKAQQIICSYVKLKETNAISVEMEFSIGDFVYLAKRTAMPYIFNEFCKKIEDSKTPEDKEFFISNVLNFGHEIWHFYDELSRCAAEKESFLIHFIDSNIHYISMVFLDLYKEEFLKEDQKKKLLENIGLITSNYWRIYYYHKKINHNYHYQILEHLLDIGYEFNKLSLVKNLNEIIDTIAYIANLFFEKGDVYGYEPIRILERSVYLCILNNSEEVYKNFVDKTKEKFFKVFFKRFPEHKTLLFKELLKIDPASLRFNRTYFLSFEEELLSQLKEENIKQFIEKLKRDLFNNDVKGDGFI